MALQGGQSASQGSLNPPGLHVAVTPRTARRAILPGTASSSSSLTGRSAPPPSGTEPDDKRARLALELPGYTPPPAPSAGDAPALLVDQVSALAASTADCLEMIRALAAGHTALRDAVLTQVVPRLEFLTTAPSAAPSSSAQPTTPSSVSPQALLEATAGGVRTALQEQEARARQLRKLPDALAKTLDKIDRNSTLSATKFVRAQTRHARSATRCVFSPTPPMLARTRPG